MKRGHRLLKDADFQTILAKKTNHKIAQFTIYGLKQSLGHTRVGISVSKKIGIAVIRNKIRRQIRMMLTAKLNLNESVDYIVIVRAPYLEKAFNENQDALIQTIASLRRKLV